MKSTKKSLLASGISLLASAALLAGATFAWFTDSVVNTGNVITAGRLAINAYAYALGDGGQSFTIPGVNNDNAFTFEADADRQDLKADTSPIIGEELFEPGKSSAKLLKVVNAGTLAAKVKLEFKTSGDLTDALWFDFVQVKGGKVIGQFQKRPMNTLATFAQTLELPVLRDESVEFILVYGMYENAGNDYQGDSFSADVTILATQYTEETDGFGSDQYDADADYLNAKTVRPENGNTLTTEELIQALNDPDWSAIRFTSDVLVDDFINLYTDTVLDFDGNTLHTSQTFELGRNDSYADVPITATLRNGIVNIDNSSGRLRAEDGSTVVFEDMTFRSANGSFLPALQVYADQRDSLNTYVFKNCVFENTYVSFEGGSGKAYEYDVTFTGCTFTATPGNGGSAVALDDYVYGSAVFEDCRFDITANGNATAAVRADGYADYIEPNTMDITLRDVTFTGTSKEEYYGKKTPVMVSVKSTDATTVIEEGSCAYTTDGAPVAYDGRTILTATPDNAQAVLDGVNQNAVVVLTAGSYGVLNLSQTENSTAVGGNTSQLQRDIKNLTILGEPGAVVDGIRIATGHIYGQPGKPVTNPVTGVTTESTVNSYYSTVNVTNLTIQGLTMRNGLRIGADTAPYCSVNGLTMADCVLEGYSATDNTVKLLHIGNTVNKIRNITVRGCTVRNAHQGVYVQAVENVTVEDCSFDGLTHNAVAVQDGSLGGTVCQSSGTVIIRNNVIVNGADRAFRFGNFAGDSVSINGNRINNSGDGDGQNCKAQSMGSATVNLDGNYWSGKTPEQAIDSSMGVIDTNPLASFS